MRIDLIPAGDSPPDSLNVLIEVPIGGEPVKYEFDKASGALFVEHGSDLGRGIETFGVGGLDRQLR